MEPNEVRRRLAALARRPLSRTPDDLPVTELATAGDLCRVVASFSVRPERRAEASEASGGPESKE